MKNLARDESGKFHWKMNLEDYRKKLRAHHGRTSPEHQFNNPALFIRGGNSEYIRMDDVPFIQLFPKAEIKTVQNAGHWVHVDAPEEFLVLSLISCLSNSFVAS